MADVKKHDTPMVDELKKGRWPSFVDDIEQKGLKGKQECLDLLGQLELSYKHKETHWKHGGIVGVFGYGGGVIGRYSDVPEMFPTIAHFHTIRVNQPASKFYSSAYLRKLCEMWDHRGSGMTNLHGSTGDLILLGTKTDQLEPIFYDLTHQMSVDLGGSGSNLRTPACCIGKARCEYSCIDTQAICYDLTQTYQDELHRPAFPYKYKFKISGCANDCVAAIARSDCAIIGTWKDDIRIDQAAVKAYIGGELKPNAGAHSDKDWGKFDIQKEVIDRCPTNCMWMEGDKLKIDNRECTRCMHCINVMPAALRPGTDTGATILLGAKAPILEGAQLATLAIPFIRMEAPYDELKDFIGKIWDWWMEEGKNRERSGELIQRQSIQELLRRTGLKAIPQMVKEPRSNPYVFWSAEEVEGGWKRDLAEFRKRHAA
ncbi:dissimilatory-type sulfite reductase subunit alpha [Dissulfurimicrobium hydrothermale]|uniref:dissimilatory-type sulfite reductase subunit alpha n=1 Tax=Dissulfurimicrobium hydrothermale TaxID=1750598 RepID=UPI001EDC0E90|nr:dissimilatory-type sulfite reductase subunit alpha [Dissulfurimicrobium hydrothermale]UKL13874.1 dissimilatory-type sulfite reductase subunit alpha [Dissulfurimicrobium hydrothermale]